MAHKVERKRARRLRLTLNIARERRAWHLARIHRTGQVDCVCGLADTYFAKRRAVSCDCRKRKHGNPRVAAGMCDVGNRDRIYEWRDEARALAVAVRSGRLDFKEERGGPSRRGHRGAKPFGLEKRERLGEWFVYRRYRTGGARDAAMRTLVRNTGRWSDGSPRAEYRASP